MEKKEIDKIMQVKGKVRGVTLQTDGKYIKIHEGEEGLRAVEAETKKMGYHIDYKHIVSTGWYSMGLRAVSLLAAKKVLNLDDEQIKKMGSAAPKYSLITKMMLKFFFSLKKVHEEAGTYWRKHYTLGILEPGGFHEDKKYFILHLKKFKLHPILCTYLLGYYLGVLEMTGGYKNARAEETKCMHRGDEYHEFVIRWD